MLDQLLFTHWALLFKNLDGFVKMWIAFFDGINKCIHLKMLATQAQNGYSTYVGMICIRRKQVFENGRILSCSTTATLMIKEFDAIHIFKQTNGFCIRSCRKVYRITIELLPIFVGLFEHPGIALVLVGNRIAQLIVHGFTDHIKVPVFTENGRNKQPVVGCPYPTICSMIAIERSSCIC